MLILDTNAIIHYGNRNIKRLGNTLYQRLGSEDELIVHPASYFEIVYKNRYRRLDLSEPVDSWIKRFRGMPGVRDVRTDWEDFYQAATLDYPVGDPADRMIVASAMIRNLPIITSDQEMLNFAGVVTIGY